MVPFAPYFTSFDHFDEGSNEDFPIVYGVSRARNGDTKTTIKGGKGRGQKRQVR